MCTTNSHQIINEVDRFRARFYDNLIEEEIKKERAFLKKQRECFHKYADCTMAYDGLPVGYEERICLKCEHIIRKKITVKHTDSKCVIA
jgi:hypothetical protein